MSKVTNEKLRADYINFLADCLKERGEEVLRTNSNELAIPVVDETGEDQYVVFTIKVPTGSREGDAYDGHSMAQDFIMRTSAKADAKEKADKKKTAKIARDEKMRAEKAAAKAERTSN